MKTTSAQSITKVSEYIASGGLKIGYLMESPVRETEKALGFPGVKADAYGYPRNAVFFLPKSQLVKVENDFYTHADAPAVMWICPPWLYKKNPGIDERI